MSMARRKTAWVFIAPWSWWWEKCNFSSHNHAFPATMEYVLELTQNKPFLHSLPCQVFWYINKKDNTWRTSWGFCGCLKPCTFLFSLLLWVSLQASLPSWEEIAMYQGFCHNSLTCLLVAHSLLYFYLMHSPLHIQCNLKTSKWKIKRNCIHAMAFCLRTSMNFLWTILSMDSCPHVKVQFLPDLTSVSSQASSSSFSNAITHVIHPLPPHSFFHPQIRIPFPVLISYNLFSLSFQSHPQCCFSQESFQALTTLTNAPCNL